MEIHPYKIHLLCLQENIHRVSRFLIGNKTSSDGRNRMWRKLSYPCFGTVGCCRPPLFQEVSFSRWTCPLDHRKRERCWRRKVLQGSCGSYRLRNLVNLIYNYLTICKWVVYEFCFWNKKQIRNKNGFLGKSSFFCLHYFSFLSLACNQSTNPSYYYAFSSWFNICFFIYPGIRSEKRKVLFSMIGINMCKVKNNHPSNQIFVYF